MEVEVPDRVDPTRTPEAELLAPRIWRSVASSALYDVTTVLAGLVLTRVVLAHLGRDQYGILLSVGGLLGYLGLADFGLGQTVTRAVAAHVAKGEREEVQAVVDTALGLYVRLALVVLVVGLGLVPLVDRVLTIAPALRGVARGYLALVAVRFAVNLPASLLGGVCLGYGRFDYVNVGRLVGTVATVALTLAAVTGGLGLVGMTALTSLALVATLLVHGLALRHLAPWLRFRVRRVDGRRARSLLSFSIYFWINNMVVLLVFQTDNLVIAGALGVGMVTAYGLTQQLLQSSMQVTFKIADALNPSYAALRAMGRDDVIRDRYLAATQYSAAVALIVATVVVAYGEWLMRLWTGPQGFAGQQVLLCFAAILVLHTPVHVASGLIAACGKLEGLTAMSVVEGVLNLALSLYWVRRHGLPGVAFATFLSMAVTTGWFVPLVALREARTTGATYLTRGLVPGLFAALPAIALAAVLALRFTPQTGLAAASHGAILVTVAAVSLVALRRHVRRSSDQTVVTPS